MEIADWKSTTQLSQQYREIRKLGLENNLAELDAFGFTILEPGVAAPVEWVMKLRETVLRVAEERTGVKHDVETGEHGYIPNQTPAFDHQYVLYYLLLEDPIFQEAICNPYLLALQSYMLGFDCRISSVTSFVKWANEKGYGEGLGLHADTPVTHPLPVGKDTHTGNSAWILTDYTRENGAIAFIPGSHRRARQPGTGEGVTEAVPIEAKAGSLLVWNGNLWHGAFPRENPGLRLVLTCYFHRSYLIPQEDYRRTVTQEILDRNPDRLKVLLGMTNVNSWEDAHGPRYEKTIPILDAALKEASLRNAGEDFVERTTRPQIEAET